MKKKIVTFALALLIGGSNLMVQPVKAVGTDSYACITQSSSAAILNVTSPIDPEPKG